MEIINAAWPEWTLEKQIGCGSYGTVYRAIRSDFDFKSYSAIKVITVPFSNAEVDSLKSEGLDTDETRTFLKGVVNELIKEIQIMQSLKGMQSIVSIEDYKVIERTDEIGWSIYIRMELLTPLNTYLSDKKLTEEEIIRLGVDICSALEICEKKSIIHRDIKPENIFVNDLGDFKLGDFGIARKLENLTSVLSNRTGTPNYMAPEVFNSTDYDHRVDLYSLGLVLYWLSNKKRLPFLDTERQLLSPNERANAVQRRLNGEPIPAPCDASSALTDAILRACNPDPNNRFSSPSLMKKALVAALKDSSIIGANLFLKGEHEDNSINLDIELDKKFEELFGNKEKPEDGSPIRQKLAAIKGRKFIDSIERSVKASRPSDSESYELFSLVPIEYMNDTSSSTWTGKHFALPDVPGYKTIIFEIYRNVDFRTLTKYYTCEPLDFTRNKSDDGSITEAVFYIDDPQEEGNQLILLHFNSEKKECLINHGILLGDSVIITRKPVPFRFLEDLWADEKHNLTASTYELASIQKYELTSEKQIQLPLEEQWYDADISETTRIIIDPETAEPVKRELFYDEACGEWKARIKIIPYKSYLVFQISSPDSNSARTPLTDFEIATYYKQGLYAFPKDVLKAAEHFEKDGSPYALYEIAVLCRCEEDLLDEGAYHEYLQSAIEAGCEEASAELAIRFLFNSNEDNEIKCKELLDKVTEHIGLKEFIVGYFTEKGILGGGLGVALNHYYEAATKDFKPACARVGTKKAAGLSDSLRAYFEDTTEKCSVADYCMGSVLFFGYGILPQKDKGLELLKESALKGCWRAAETLYYIYKNDLECQNERESLKWLQAIGPNNPSLTNALANRLLDGIGCEICDENDRLAFSLFQKAADGGNKAAKNNLGWMYKNGRGCPVDYARAMQLFIDAESPSSFYHLGDMYEHGLGVISDLEIATHYYEKGAEGGSEKAKERLKKITKSGSS